MKVFVYGTLMRGQSNNGLLTSHKARFSHKAHVFGDLISLGSFPGALNVNLSTNKSILGEVWSHVTPECLSQLDMLEGFDSSNPHSPHNMYERLFTTAYDFYGKATGCHVYEYNAGPRYSMPKESLIETGWFNMPDYCKDHALSNDTIRQAYLGHREILSKDSTMYAAFEKYENNLKAYEECVNEAQ